ARVQGDGAVADVCRALALVGRLEAVDVAIVGRGGGAAEDLWTFNNEQVARAVAAVPVPVISAVGHETDVTLCDLVADHRAAPPSAAAEAATPDRADVVERLDVLAAGLARGLHAPTTRAAERVAHIGERLVGGIERVVELGRLQVAALSGQLDALSPLRVLQRGYAVARDETGRVLRRVGRFPPGGDLLLRLSDGGV